MSNDATVRFGYDGRELDAGLRASEQRVSRFGSQTESAMRRASGSAAHFEKSMKSVSGGGMRNMGNVSMQIQDIAVQLQSGTKASIIFAQQGSQMLSAFGPIGAIAGGVAAVAAAFYTMGESASESFKKVIKDSREFRAESALLVQSTNAENLADNLSKVREQMNALNERKDSLNSFMGDLGARIGGGNTSEMRRGLDEEKAKQAEVYGRMVDRVLITSNQELEVSRLTLAGRKEEADALERKYQLQSRIVAIDQLRIQDWAKEKLKQDATEQAGNAEKVIAEALAKKNKEKQAAASKELESRRTNVKLLRDEFEMNSLKLQGNEHEAKLVEERMFMTKRVGELTAAGYGPSEAIRQAADEWKNLAKQQKDDEAKKQKAQKAEIENKRETLSMERKSVDLLEAEAKGQTRKVDKLKEEAYITQRMKELSGLGIGPDEAEGMARRELKAMKEKEKYLETGRAHIGGVKTKRYMGSTFHGLDEFDRLQEKDYEPTGPTKPGYRKGQPVPKYDAFGRDNVPPTSAQRNGRYMGGNKGGTRSYSDVTVASTAASQKSGGLAEKIDESNKHLKGIDEKLT